MKNLLELKTAPRTKALIEAIVQGMQDKKAADITLLDLQPIDNAIAAYFILCTGHAKTQVAAITDNILDVASKKVEQHPWKQEGFANREWILLDYVEVVVHILLEQQRAFYDLDSLWGDAIITRIKS